MMSTSGERPNILFICTDQQHFRMLSCAGNPWLATPNMDRLAAMGTRFERCYCTNPVCVPSRFSLFTGRMPSAIGMRANGGRDLTPFGAAEVADCLGHLLREAGYRTAYAGKVHCPIQLSAERLGFEYLCRDERDRCAVESARFIRQDHHQPWMLVSSFINPHDICYHGIRAFAQTDFDHAILRGGTTELAELDAALALPQGIDEDTFFAEHCPPLPPNFAVQEDEPEGIRQLLAERPFRRDCRAHWNEREWRLHRWAYHRLTERVDAQIGVVLDALEQSGRLADTLIIFTSDHGDHDASHRLEHKTIFYEEAARVPFIMAWPGRIPAGTVDDEHLICNGLDLLPTCATAAGARIPEHCRGRDLLGMATGASAEPWRTAVYGENSHSRMLCTQRWKYVRYDQGASAVQLYDLATDPYETRNAAAGEPAVVAELGAELDAHIDEHRALAVS